MPLFIDHCEALKGWADCAVPKSGADLTPLAEVSWRQVLTTYDALRRDVHRGADGGPARTLRRRKRYQALPTPLTRLRWWRVCLDEVRVTWQLRDKVRITAKT